MKKITALVALLTVGIVAQANGDKDRTVNSTKVAIVQNSNQKFKVVYLEKFQGTVGINITNANGDVVHSQKVNNTDGFAQSYNFESLPEGTYTFKITNPDGTRIKKAVEFKKSISKPQFKANIVDVNDNNKFRLAVIKYNSKPVEVNIYDSKDNLLYSEKISDKESFRKTFDLGSIKDDNIRFDIKNLDNTVSLMAK